MPPTDFTLTTERLRLRPFASSDVDFLHALWVHPQVREFLWDNQVIERAVTEEIVAASESSFDERGFGFWVIACDEEDVGFAGLREFGDDGEIELLYGLDPKWWGSGVATEASVEVLRYAFDEVSLARVFAGTDPPNTKSIAVIERLGMTLEGRRTLPSPSGPVESVYYYLDRAQSTRVRP